MNRRNFYARAVCGAVTSGLLMTAALSFPACTNEAGDCHNTLSCPLPAYCAEAGDARIDGCFSDPDGVNNAQDD